MKTRLIFLFISCVLGFTYLNAQEYKTGLNFNDSEYEETLMSAPLSKGDYKLPSSASLEKYCPTPGSQGLYGTCVGWATAYGARTIIYAIQHNLTKKQIDAITFSPSFIYNQIKSPGDDNCQNGSSIKDALELMRDKGVVKLTDFEYNCVNSVNEDVISKATDFKIRDCIRIFGLSSDSATKINTTKKSLSENHPVIIGLNMPSSFFNVTTDLWTPAAEDDNTKTYAGHAMTVVGYNDSIYGGAIRIMNSWGTEWGDKGFVWIKYNDFADFCKYAYEVIELPTETVNLSGEVVFKLMDNSEMAAIPKLTQKGLVVEEATDDALVAYNMKTAYASGTKFRFYIQNNRAAYVYALSTDLSGKINKIFPYKDGISPYLGYSSNTIVIPSETAYIKMDATPGRDFLCVFYSKHPLDIDSLKTEMEKLSGISFGEKITTVLGDNLVPYDNVNYKLDKISFDAEIKDNNQFVIPLMIEFEHK